MISSTIARFRRLASGRPVATLLLGFMIGAVVFVGSLASLSFTSSTAFCTSCHEMNIVAEQGWMHSQHYNNPKGVVAQCADCHIPPELLPKLWVKTRDGTKDTLIHFFGGLSPAQMDWDELAVQARSKIYDSSCERCHSNPTPKGAPIKALVAHRENLRMDNKKRCVDCHRKEFHGRFEELVRAPASGTEPRSEQ